MISCEQFQRIVNADNLLCTQKDYRNFVADLCSNSSYCIEAGDNYIAYMLGHSEEHGPYLFILYTHVVSHRGRRGVVKKLKEAAVGRKVFYKSIENRGGFNNCVQVDGHPHLFELKL